MKKMFFGVAVAISAIIAASHAQCAENNTEDLVKVGGEGRVAIVNVADVASAPLETAAKKIGNFLMIYCEVLKGTWTFSAHEKSFSDVKANAAVFVIKDATLPMSLVAMESRWGVVNAIGLSEKSLEKEILRVATIVLGGGASKYPTSTMRPVFSRDDLETKVGQVITFDSLMAIHSYIPSLGIKQYQMMTREEAIAEGLIKN